LTIESADRFRGETAHRLKQETIVFESGDHLEDDDDDDDDVPRVTSLYPTSSNQLKFRVFVRDGEAAVL
jgi:hypothetical protein